MKQLRPICLASASPRRRELLERYGLKFEVHAVAADETARPGEGARELVARLAKLKAELALPLFGEHLIVAGDTAVVVDGEMLGKPRDRADAAAMIGRLAGRQHHVLSAYHLLDAGTGHACGGVSETAVTFRPLPPEWIAWYADLPEARDKAGGYAIQGVGGALVKKIEGSCTTVMGFPIELVVWEMVARRWISL